MSGGLVTAAYIVAAILFIFSLAGLSKHETSRQGNNFGIAGMAIALLATIFGPDTGNVAWILVAMIIGGAIGIYRSPVPTAHRAGCSPHRRYLAVLLQRRVLAPWPCHHVRHFRG